MKNGDIKSKSNNLIDRELKKTMSYLRFEEKNLLIVRKTSIKIVHHNNNDSNKNEDINTSNEIVSSIKDEVKVNNNIIKDKRKKYSTKKLLTYQF